MESDSFNMLLTHVLDVIAEMPEVPVDMIFSGHTHGGQIRLPRLGGFMFGFRLPRKYLEGMHIWRNMATCVSRGLGASRTATPRFFCRPEAVLLEVVTV
jgi:predicted MPP superfamily phosphohydrolase